MDKIKIRKQAISRYENSESPKEIYMGNKLLLRPRISPVRVRT